MPVVGSGSRRIELTNLKLRKFPWLDRVSPHREIRIYFSAANAGFWIPDTG
jgi:hypothetical protein